MNTRFFQPRLNLVLTIAVAVRVAAVWVDFDNLQIDRDQYLGIAESLVEGRGFSVPETAQPTAFRPPLYPLLLSFVLWCNGSFAAIAAVHVFLGTATVALTWLIGRRIDDERTAVVAAVLVAVDPMLVRYTAQLMTETTFTFLVALYLLAWTRQLGNAAAASTRQVILRAVPIGALFGLCALCRPSIWAYGALSALWWLGDVARAPKTRRTALISALAASLSAAAMVAPWGIRNQLVFDRPILTTTHGGYTLLLGNNPVFYREVVSRPWGTVWESDSLLAWQDGLEMKMAENPAVQGEPARDRWMQQQAFEHIRAQPKMFLSACWLRVRRFWSVAPLGPAAQSISRPMLIAVSLFYLAVFLGMACGILRVLRAKRREWTPLLFLLLAFTLVHTVYWSNARMRAPLIPAVALLAAHGWRGVLGTLRRNR